MQVIAARVDPDFNGGKHWVYIEHTGKNDTKTDWGKKQPRCDVCGSLLFAMGGTPYCDNNDYGHKAEQVPAPLNTIRANA